MAQKAIPNQNRALRQYPLKTNETTVLGDMVYLDANGDVTICGADPATVLGFQMMDYNDNLEVDVYSGHVIVACALPGSTFWLPGSTTFTQANEGQSYGAVTTSGAVTVDISDTTNLVFKVHRVDLTRDLAEVSVLSSVAQLVGD